MLLDISVVHGNWEYFLQIAKVFTELNLTCDLCWSQMTKRVTGNCSFTNRVHIWGNPRKRKRMYLVFSLLHIMRDQESIVRREEKGSCFLFSISCVRIRKKRRSDRLLLSVMCVDWKKKEEIKVLIGCVVGCRSFILVIPWI